MAKSKKEAGSELIKGVLALIPEDQRASVQALFSTDQILETLGSPVAAAEDKIQLALDKEQATQLFKTKLDSWYQDVLPQLQAGSEAIKKLEELEKNGSVGDPPQPPAGITKDDLARHVSQAVAQSERGAVGAMSYFTTLAVNHLKNFGEVLDVTGLVSDAQKAGKTVGDYYAELVAPKVQELAQKSEKEREEKIRQDERTKVQAEMRKQGHGVYPLAGLVSDEPTTLVGLKGSNGQAPDFGVEAAVSEFYRGGRGAS